ncbi:hypothetical protein DNTS_007576 [Danionella cerebrum]|uniref:Somatolactin n=1 Tax=Danionella cerebrum TaxID=2873325 RepID=A0A553R329_9TELE|nr:hypothetical protein DNTS_007576 [Danionella translucida]
MKTTTALQVFASLVLCCARAVCAFPVDCQGQMTNGVTCSISLEKLLDRAVQHAELIYRISEETSLLFNEILNGYGGVHLFIPGGAVCAPKTVSVPMSKSEVQQISVGSSTEDRWLLHSILILVQVWIDPLVNLKESLKNYDNPPIGLFSRTEWMVSKLVSLEQGILVLIREILGEGALVLDPHEDKPDSSVTSHIETISRDYSVIYCFRKDAHKMQTFLKFLKCRQMNMENCSFF